MKKAQAAMEFLMTYGWSIFVVLASISALVHYGILSPDRFLPEMCIVSSEMECLDFKSTFDSIDLVLYNNYGVDLKNISVSIEPFGNSKCGKDELNIMINKGKYEFNIPCDFEEENNKFKGKIIIEYKKHFVHKKEGEIIVLI